MADNYSFKDAAGLAKSHASAEITTDVHASKHIQIDAAGNEIFYAGSNLRSLAVTVTTSATALPSTALTSRRALWVHNNGSATIYLGASDVGPSSGFPLLAGQSAILEIGGLVVYGRVSSGSVEARVMEIA